jgi:branched-chain amino acid transport system ATP-binding protein
MVLELRGLGKRFGGLQAVRDVDLALAPGERVGLLGPNGAGKTTLVNCITGDLKPSGGDVLLRGERVTALAPHRLFARGLARTYQVVNPFPALTALESTALEMKEVELARILAGRPSVVFLDELLAGLRPSEMSALLDVLLDVAEREGWTVVMIEHLIGAIMRFCPRVVVMNEGRVIADGPAEDVARGDAVVDAYLGAKWRAHA